MPEEIVNAKGMTENGKRTVGLESQVRFWDTPTAHDGRRPQDDTSTQGANLLRQVQYWPTPCAQDDNKTPEAHLAMKARMKGGARNTITSLSVLTQQWPTPSAGEAKGRSYQYDQHDKTKPRDSLTGMTEKFSPPVPVISTDGIELSPTVNSITERRRLNPEFVEWLMGWPIGLTSTEPTACDAAAMASWRRRLRRHLLNWCGG